jgi:hypothetical protein
MKIRRAHWLFAAPLLASVCVFTAAARGPGATPDERAEQPSRLDYLVLASFADSSNILALSAYSHPR